MTSRREELGDTGSVEASFGKTESGTETSATGTDDDSIVLVVLQQRLEPQSSRMTIDYPYNDRVLVGDVAIGLLGAQGSAAKDPG